MKTPTPHRLLQYVQQGLRLKRFLENPGDGRRFPQIPAKVLLWTMVLGQVLREWSFHGLESLVGSAHRRDLGVSRKFGDDALGYFTERLDPTATRRAIIQIARQAKRNKTFQKHPFIGLALDGTTVGRCRQQQCPNCRPWHTVRDEIAGYRHHLVMLSVVGTGLSLPLDVEPFGSGDSEYAAGQRLLRRVIPQLGPRFADYLVVDGEFATAPFLHACDHLGLAIVARLKGNLRDLSGCPNALFPAGTPAQLSLGQRSRRGLGRRRLRSLGDFALVHRARPLLSPTQTRRHGHRGLLVNQFIV